MHFVKILSKIVLRLIGALFSILGWIIGCWFIDSPESSKIQLICKDTICDGVCGVIARLWATTVTTTICKLGVMNMWH